MKETKMKIEQIEKFDILKIDVEDETFQGRVWYDELKLESIINDIKIYGQRSPVGIKKSPKKKGMYQIIYGFHRVKAILKMKGKTTSVFIYSDITDRECEEIAVRDNEMHADLTPMEKVLQCSHLKEQGWTVKELSEAYGAKSSIIYEWLQVSKAPRWLLQLLHINKLSIAHIANLLRTHPKNIFTWTCCTLAGNWSVAHLEKEMKFHKKRDKNGEEVWFSHYTDEDQHICGYLCPKELSVKTHMCHGSHRVKRRHTCELKQSDEYFVAMKRCEYCVDEIKRCPKIKEEVTGCLEWVLCSYPIPDTLKPFWEEYRKQKKVKDEQHMLDEMLKGKAISEEKYKQYSKMDLQILPKYPSAHWIPDSEEQAESNSKPFTLKEQKRLMTVIADSPTLFSEALNNLEQLPGTETESWLNLVNVHWLWNDHCGVCGERYWVNDSKKYYKCKKEMGVETKTIREIDEETDEIIERIVEIPTVISTNNELTEEEKNMCFECYMKKKDDELRLNVKSKELRLNVKSEKGE